jgi:hypothetical protein
VVADKHGYPSARVRRAECLICVGGFSGQRRVDDYVFTEKPTPNRGPWCLIVSLTKEYHTVHDTLYRSKHYIEGRLASVAAQLRPYLEVIQGP